MEGNSEHFDGANPAQDLPPNPFGPAPDMGPRSRGRRVQDKVRSQAQKLAQGTTGEDQYVQGLVYDGVIASVKQCIRDTLVTNEPRHQNEFRDYFWFTNAAYVILVWILSDTSLAFLALTPFIPLYSAASRQIRRGASRDVSFYFLWLFPVNIWGLLRLTRTN